MPFVTHKLTNKFDQKRMGRFSSSYRVSKTNSNLNHQIREYKLNSQLKNEDTSLSISGTTNDLMCKGIS